MWMMGYNDGGEYNNVAADSFNGNKLRPPIPRQPLCTTATSIAATNNHYHYIKPTDLFALNHHLASMADQNKREQMNSQPVVVSSRWNPTPEQLRALEDLYSRGTRTPSADQIQHITAQLRLYGRVEGKNVFYWFQNHKARERQKRRRQMEPNPDQKHNLLNQNFERNKDTDRTVNEVEQAKNWTNITNCGTLAESQESVSVRRATKAVMAECRVDRRVQLNEEEWLNRRKFMGRNATWQMKQQSPYHHLILYPTNTPHSITTTTITTSQIPKASALHNRITPMDTKGNFYKRTHQEEDGFGEESQTLQLFPLNNEEDDGNGAMNEKETETLMSAAEAMEASNFAPTYQFYEFLPLKN